jgi:hypothetical protein
MIIPHILTSIGLLADVAGAVLLAVGLIIKEDDAIKLSAVTGMSYTMDKPPSRAELLKQPAVQDRLKQSRWAKIGIAVLVVGFLLQLLGTWIFP